MDKQFMTLVLLLVMVLIYSGWLEYKSGARISQYFTWSVAVVLLAACIGSHFLFLGVCRWPIAVAVIIIGTATLLTAGRKRHK